MPARTSRWSRASSWCLRPLADAGLGGIAGVVLAAGAGTRLRPLTDRIPKALCPVDNRPLVDIALERVRLVADDVAVNVHHHREQMEAHLAGRGVHISVEEPEALGTGGALGRLREWIGGRAVAVTNADAWMTLDVEAWAAGWDGSGIRLLAVRDDERPDFQGGLRYAGVALLPWDDVRRLRPEPSGLYEVLFRDALADGRAEIIPMPGLFFDCGTPRDWLAANCASRRQRIFHDVARS